MLRLNTAAIAIAVLGVIVVGWLAIRDHRAERIGRRGLLDRCAGVLDGALIRHGGDDFPSIEGTSAGVRLRADFVPDTMTIRRLPQLWLSFTRFEDFAGVPEFAVLVRPAGTEYYSLTTYLDQRLDAPPGLPEEVLIRGSRDDAQGLLDAAAPSLRSILADPRIKEVGVMRKGLRLVWQCAEGRRGEHLLLRQSTFDDAAVSAAEFQRLLDLLEGLSQSVRRWREKGTA